MQFSIIIPTYNREKQIERALSSVVQQDFSDWEIIVVDDGSTDQTATAIKKYLKQYPNKIKYFYKKNGGVGSARNYGITKARGEYFIFLDSDDELTKNALGKMAEKIEEFKEYKIFFFSTKNFDGQRMSTVAGKYSVVTLKDVLQEEKIVGEFLPCIAKTIFKEHKFPEKVNGGESLLWWKTIGRYRAVYFSFLARIYHFDANNSLLRKKITPESVKNSLVSNRLTVNKYKKELKQYNPKKLGLIYFNIARLEALSNEQSFHHLWLGIKYAGCDFKNCLMYFISLIDYKFVLTNFLSKINNLSKK